MPVAASPQTMTPSAQTPAKAPPSATAGVFRHPGPAREQTLTSGIRRPTAHQVLRLATSERSPAMLFRLARSPEFSAGHSGSECRLVASRSMCRIVCPRPNVYRLARFPPAGTLAAFRAAFCHAVFISLPNQAPQDLFNYGKEVCPAKMMPVCFLRPVHLVSGAHPKRDWRYRDEAVRKHTWRIETQEAVA